MSAKQARLQRLLRLRSVEHRIAKVRVTQAEAKISNLLQIDDRLAALRAGLLPEQGGTTGLNLQSLSEMAGRLDHARRSMATPISEAVLRRDDSHKARIKAHQNEDSLAKVHGREAWTAMILKERQADANRPRLKRNRKLENA
jgi:hypothetical protein